MDIDISLAQFFSPDIWSKSDSNSEMKCLKGLHPGSSHGLNCTDGNCMQTCTPSEPHRPCWLTCDQWNSNTRLFSDTATICKCKYSIIPPKCGLDNVCRTDDIGIYGVIVIMSVVIIGVTYASINRFMQSTISSWPCFPKKVDYKIPEVAVDNDVKSFLDRLDTNQKPGGGLLNVASTNIRASLFSMKNGPSGPQLRKHFCRLVIYRDTIVAIKDLTDDFDVSLILKKEKAELKSMMSLNHRNVALFYGLLFDEERHFLLQEYGVRGSLRDILSSRIQLTWEVKRSLCNDIVDGMAYIHQYLGSRL